MKSTTILLLLAVAVLAFAGFRAGDAAADAATPAYRKVPLDELVETAHQVRPDLQMKVTWCGPQSRPITTIVLGTSGHRLNAEKYVPLRRKGWHYGNDDPAGSILYHQLTADEWTRLLDGMASAGWAKRANPKTPTVEKRFHVILCATGWLEREYAWAELFLDGDTPELREILLKALNENSPLRDGVASRIFRGY